MRDLRKALIWRVLGGVIIAAAALGCGAAELDGESLVGEVTDGDATRTPASTTTNWRDAQALYKKVVEAVGEGTFSAAPITFPDRVTVTSRACGKGCNSIRSAILTCPGLWYPAVQGFRALGARLLRFTNGSETGAETAHGGIWFYSCDDFCGGKPHSGCAPGNGDRENEYGIARSLENNRFRFYQSYDSNNCGARHRVDTLNAQFDPEARGSEFLVSVLPDGSYEVRQLRSDGSLRARQRISNCTIEGDCKVVCAGSTPGERKQGCDQKRTSRTCPVNCAAKHSDRVNHYRNRASGKINIHQQKKQGGAFVYWSEPDASGKPSGVYVDSKITVKSAGPAQGTCSLAGEL